jgi:hypothetical protein
MTQQLLTKQDLLTFQSETNAVGVIDQSNESATPPVYISWPGYPASTVVNGVGHQQLNAGVYKEYLSLTPGSVMHFSCDFLAGTANACSVTVNDTTAWTNMQETFVTNLSTTVWKTEQWSWTVYPNGKTNIHFLVQAPGSAYTQPAGSVKIRNYTVSTSPNVTNFTSKISGHDIACTGTVSAVSVVSTSDQSIKSEYQDPSADLLKIFDGAEVHSYVRDDMPGRRIGFKAQDLQAHLPKEISNLVYMNYSRDQPLLALDYSRLSTVLWCQAKEQQKQLRELTERIKVLEANLPPQ